MKCNCLVSAVQEDFLSRYVGVKPLNDNFKKKESNSEGQKHALYQNSFHTARTFEVLDSLRKDEFLCDVKLETDDGTIIYGHKVILASATPYFHAMFTNFKESINGHVILRELDPTAVKCLVDFIYTAQIMITDDNVQGLLHAADLLQLHDVRDVCCDFLQTQLNPMNCLNVKTLISLYGCEEYLLSFKSYIQQNFTMVVQSDEFLCLSYEELVEIISCNYLNDPSEEKVFECVVNWVNHLSCRKDKFPKLMEHVRLPLASKQYLLNTVKKEPLIKNCFEGKDYLIEALHYHLSKNDDQPDIVLKTIHTKPRQLVSSSKIILVVGESFDETLCINWYDPSTNTWQLVPEINMSESQNLSSLVVFNNQSLFFLSDSLDYEKVSMLDLFSSSPHLQQSIPKLHTRVNLGVGVLDSCIYVVGGEQPSRSFKSAEVFNISTKKWRILSDMSIARRSCGVGILNDHLYAIGGYDCRASGYLKSVERYCPLTNTWTRVADMNLSRCFFGIGVLNGVMYVVGGCDGYQDHSSIEAYNPSSDTWTYVCDMPTVRKNPGVVALDGLLYIMSSNTTNNTFLTETYDPESNNWTVLSKNMTFFQRFSGAVTIYKPPNF